MVKYFKRSIAKEEKQQSNFKPFYIIVYSNAAQTYLCNTFFEKAQFETDIKKYNSEKQAEHAIIKLEDQNYYETEDLLYPDDCDIVFIKDQKQYNDLLKQYDIKF